MEKTGGSPVAQAFSESKWRRSESVHQNDERTPPGRLIVNADDWGYDIETTGKILACAMEGAVSSVSAMVFMEDSVRAAAVARERGIDAGLHINLTAMFSAPGCSTMLMAHQEKVSRYLRWHRLAQVVFHPGLVNSFKYVVAAQVDEFERLYGAAPDRLDGHHHMHLCANVLLQGLLPPNTIVRRNFSFEAGEKSLWNRLYRRLVDRMLARRHRLTDYFFSLAPLQPESRLQRILSLSLQYVVEVEVHPINKDEYQFLTEGGVGHLAGDVRIASPCAISWGSTSV